MTNINAKILKFRKKIMRYAKIFYLWYRENFAALALFGFVQIMYFGIKFLPYFNWFTKPLLLVLLFFDWAIIIRLLRLGLKEIILFAIVLYEIGSFFSLMQIQKVAEFFGVISYGALISAAFIILIKVKESYRIVSKTEKFID